MGDMFRDLRADEIECRIGTVKEGAGVSLLLYKDARCDMRILDETVGPFRWKRWHGVINGNLYCTVSIYDDTTGVVGDWVEKQDVGVESRTEAEKGEASDAFKRACVNWGIGRELYTAPFIWIKGATKQDRFFVREIEISDKRITRLVIGACDKYGNKTDVDAFTWPRKASGTTGKGKGQDAAQDAAGAPIGTTRAKALMKLLEDHNVNVEALLKQYGVKSLKDLTEDKHLRIIELIRKADAEKDGSKRET